MYIEFILALEDGTWYSQAIFVPDNVTRHIPYESSEWDSEVVAWGWGFIDKVNEYKDVIFVGILNSEPEQFSEEDN